MRHRIDPEGSRLPIKLDSTSNGEFASLTIPERETRAHRRQFLRPRCC